MEKNVAIRSPDLNSETDCILKFLDCFSNMSQEPELLYKTSLNWSNVSDFQWKY